MAMTYTLDWPQLHLTCEKIFFKGKDHRMKDRI